MAAIGAEYTVKSWGPSTDQAGGRGELSFYGNCLKLYITCRASRTWSIPARTTPRMPRQLSSLEMSVMWFMVSKAADKSSSTGCTPCIPVPKVYTVIGYSDQHSLHSAID